MFQILYNLFLLLLLIQKEISGYQNVKIVEGIDKMIERCKAYIDAGAEIIFPEALEDEKDFEKVRKECGRCRGNRQ